MLAGVSCGARPISAVAAGGRRPGASGGRVAVVVIGVLLRAGW